MIFDNYSEIAIDVPVCPEIQKILLIVIYQLDKNNLFLRDERVTIE